jgi:tetratricopeptide (TPR) repeat protein
VPCFTGRHNELALLSRSLGRTVDRQAPAVVISVISGTAGVGKTALAVHWAHQVAGRFPDGQLYVNLRGYDLTRPVPAADALARFLRSLGVPGQDIPLDQDERAARYRSLLAGRRILVVLDNAGSAEQVRPLLPGDSGCTVLVTSRDTLAGLVAVDGAWPLDLELLQPEDAVALLRSLIGGRADDDPEDAAELAGLCARLPLALRIAAELAVTRRATPLRELVAELSASRLDSLDAGEDRADIRAVFSWSHRQLPEDVARTFALAGLHPGEDLDEYAAAALTGTSAGQAREAMGQLHRASLIQVSGPGRYAMHDLLRAYAREQVTKHDTDDVCHQALTRLFTYYLTAAAAAMNVLFPAEAHQRPRTPAGVAVVPVMAGRDDARAWLDQERANLTAVVVHSADHGWVRLAADVAATLYRYLINGGYLPEAETIYSHAIRAARQSGDLAAEASALTGLGGIALMSGRFHDALGYYQVALERYRRCDDRAGQARALSNLGITEYRLNNHRSAAGYHGEAIAAFEDAGDRLGTATSLCSLAGTEIEQGSLDQASGHLQLALQVFREQKDQHREATALAYLGQLSQRRGEFTQAAAFTEHSLAIYRRIDHPVGVADALANLGEISLRKGDYPQATSYLRQGLVLYRQAGYQAGEIFVLRTLAETLHQTGQPAAGRAELVTVLSLAAETGNTYQQASAHRDLAESHHHDGQDEQARHHWQQALTLYSQTGATEADDIRLRLATHQTERSDTTADQTGLAAS